MNQTEGRVRMDAGSLTPQLIEYLRDHGWRDEGEGCFQQTTRDAVAVACAQGQVDHVGGRLVLPHLIGERGQVVMQMVVGTGGQAAMSRIAAEEVYEQAADGVAIADRALLEIMRRCESMTGPVGLRARSARALLQAAGDVLSGATAVAAGVGDAERDLRTAIEGERSDDR